MFFYVYKTSVLPFPLTLPLHNCTFLFCNYFISFIKGARPPRVMGNTAN